MNRGCALEHLLVLPSINNDPSNAHRGTDLRSGRSRPLFAENLECPPGKRCDRIGAPRWLARGGGGEFTTSDQKDRACGAVIDRTLAGEHDLAHESPSTVMECDELKPYHVQV